MKLSIDPRAAELLQPVRGLLDTALGRLPEAPPFEVTLGSGTAPFAERHGQILVLSEGLCGPGIHHALEPDGPLPRMDRWRRAACCVLEAAAIDGIAHSMDREPGDDWRWVGLAMDMVDTVAPALACGTEGVALAVQTGSPGRYPRAGVAVMRAARDRGDDPWAFGRQLIDGAIVSPVEWLAMGSWVFTKGAASLPVPVERVGDMDIPCAIDGWRWQPLCVPAHPRGGRIDVEGPGAVGEAWAEADHEHRTLACATDGVVQLRAHSGGPVGEWVVASAEGFGQVMGARGVSFRFEASGRMELTFADAFVGPLAAVAMAEEVGTSGVATGKWSVAGAWRLRFEGIDDTALTMHGRQRDAFRMPARGFGIAAWLQALEEEPWAWQLHADRMVLRGRMLGGWVDVRLKRA
ncbi:MAG: hypothetical protein R3F61_18770 [Myxococcota bacterium]